MLFETVKEQGDQENQTKTGSRLEIRGEKQWSAKTWEELVRKSRKSLQRGLVDTEEKIKKEICEDKKMVTISAVE